MMIESPFESCILFLAKQGEGADMNFLSYLLWIVFRLQMAVLIIFRYRSFRNRLKHPMYFQNKVLKEINKIYQVSADGGLRTKPKVIHFAKTSGTTDQPKLIPVTEKGLRIQKYGLQIFAAAQYIAFPDAFRGRLLAVTGPAAEGYTESGIPYGSTSGMIYRDMPSVIKKKYLLPEAVFSVKDYELRYRLILRLALRASDLSSVALPNPSTLRILISILDREINEMAEEIRTGTPLFLLNNPSWMEACQSPELKEITAQLFVSDVKRYNELDYALKKFRSNIPPGISLILNQRGIQMTLSDLWPDLRVIGTWTKGNCGEILNSVKHRFGKDVSVSELGYLASECRGTVNTDPFLGQTVPLVDSVYYEFVSESDFENEKMNYLNLDQLSVGSKYYIFITTYDGLRRYHMNDIMYVSGKYLNTPVLEFVQKGKGVTNLTGEKLYEWQTLEAVNRACRESGIRSFFSMAVADLRDGYTFYIESENLKGYSESSFSRILDSHLKNINSEYESKRSSGRLQSPEIRFLIPGASEEYRRHHVRNGRADWQFKTVNLTYRESESFDFTDYLVCTELFSDSEEVPCAG
jgi:hypothetical protein